MGTSKKEKKGFWEFMSGMDKDDRVVAIIIPLALLAFFVLMGICYFEANRDNISRWWNQEKIEVVGENGQTYDNYYEPCTNNDFVAAHLFVDKMKVASKKDVTITEKAISDATMYVFQKEATFLLTGVGEDANKRVLFLVKELPDSLNANGCDMLMDLAIMIKDAQLCKDVIELYESEEHKTEANKKYKQALKEGKFD